MTKEPTLARFTSNNRKKKTYKTVSNGGKLVPAILYSGIIVNKENVSYTIIEEGYQKEEDVYN